MQEQERGVSSCEHFRRRREQSFRSVCGDPVVHLTQKKKHQSFLGGIHSTRDKRVSVQACAFRLFCTFLRGPAPPKCCSFWENGKQGTKIEHELVFLKLFRRRRDIPAKSRDIPPKKFDFLVARDTELFGPHPFTWKTPTPPEISGPKSLGLGSFFFPEKKRRESAEISENP